MSGILIENIRQRLNSYDVTSRNYRYHTITQLSGEGTENDQNIKGPTIGIRHVQVALLFLLLTVGMGMRSQISVAIVAMTDNSTSPNPDIPTYNWTNKSVVLSSFFWGYMVLQLVAGELGRRYGTKIFLIGAMSVNATACCVTPLLAEKIGSYGVIGCRVSQGIAQAFFYSSIYNLLGRWVPISERSRLGTVALTGCSLGNIISLSLVGYICSTSLGWPASYYLYGILGYGWVLLWFFFGANSPAEHGKISAEEKRYIESSLMTKTENKKQKTPWKAILTSLPAWSISVAYFGQNWGYTTLSTEIPTFYSKVLHFDMAENGLLSALPAAINLTLSFGTSTMADYLINHNYLSRTVTRKIFTSIGSIVPTIALLSLSFFPENAKTLCVLMLILPDSFNSFLYGGNYMTHVDISPNYAGVLQGLSNFIPNFCNILAPLLVQVVVTDESNKMQWRTIFITSAMMFFLSNLFYVIFASGEVQWWNEGYPTEKTDEEENDKE